MENPHHNHFDFDSQPMVPLAFIICSGRRDKRKIQLANAMLVDINVHLKMKRPNKGKKCPYYMPSSQNQKLRSFLGRMNSYYDWNIGESDLKGFRGSLNGVMQELYAKREKEFVSSTCVVHVNYYFEYSTKHLPFYTYCAGS